MEYTDIMPGMWILVAIIFSSALLLFAFASVVYVAYHFMSLVVSMQTALIREFKGQSKAVDIALGDIPNKEAKLKEFIKARMAPTDGGFEPYSDEGAFVQEQVDELRRQGMSQEELDAFVKQAVSEIGKTKTTG
jgi:hypothetical protein